MIDDTDLFQSTHIVHSVHSHFTFFYIYYSTRHVQRLLKRLGLKRRANLSPVEEIIIALEQELASGSGHVIGIRPMQYRLQKKYNLNVSRQVAFI